MLGLMSVYGRLETPAEHFRNGCGGGIMCTHIQFCRECVNVFGLCEDHADNPDESIQWRVETAVAYEL